MKKFSYALDIGWFLRNESCNGWQPLNGVELGVWVRYVPVEEDLAWCRSTASGSAPESSEEEVSSEAFGMGIPGRS